MTSSWIIAPVAIPAMTAAFLVLALRHSLAAQRVVSVAATVLQLAVAIGLYVIASDGELRTYLLGNWPAPFGIVLVLDRLAAIMLLLTGLLASGIVLAALGEWDKRGRHFHALFQFQLLGVNGAFLTGDLFNLFVFFEVLLIASYGLMLHGGGPRRLVAGFHYIGINLIGSTVFLFAAGLIYAATGTLNMADLAAKVPLVMQANQPLLAAGALLLLTVFATKSAMVPLHWWLPTAYGSTSPPVAAMFAIMTKVGAYSLIRVYTLIFGASAGPLADIAAPWILPAGILTLVLGTIGVLATRRIVDLVCYSLIASMGTLLIAIGLATEAALAAAMYYALQSTVAGAALFLLAGLLAPEKDSRVSFAWQTQYATLFAGFYFLLAIATVGLPPLAGFIGKLLILDAGRAASAAATVWPAILITSLLLTIGFARGGIRIFWKPSPSLEEPAQRAVPAGPVAVIAGMIVVIAGLSLFAGAVMDDLTAMAEQLRSPERYIAAVLRAHVTLNLTGE
ncbi:monovalent cation/H+ antiporter subunit D [Pseudolabrys sp. FHR47]|uniref:monovalent cation/H+ antiporter subunit D n=1 Tax=Pseudolabrys sp. FHR47 TaxID=2562284 RepID=UPI0010BEA49B|nr:monovalent cation/H+ antiporter subunit D [Pseudolabrys sp. FHR47]